jgi:hypothetical protein
MPALNLAKKKAGTTVCLSNTKNLALAWYMYMGENDGRIMSSEENHRLGKRKFVGWLSRDLSGQMQNPGGSDE